MLTSSRLGPGRVTSPGPDLPCATLHKGANMPLMAFGTYMETLQPDHDQTVSIIEQALDVGYRHFDTAHVYNTESIVGAALSNKVKAGAVTRGDVFVTTKLWRNAHLRQDVVPSLRASLNRLGLEYVDMYLIHWPTAFPSGDEMFPKKDGKMVYENIDYLETWQGMEECVHKGLSKAIGISNFNSKQTERILENCRIKPANMQIESHPYLTNSKLIDFCHKRDITVMAYSPLFGFNQSYRDSCGWPSLFEDPKIKTIAERHKATPAQVALRYQIQRGVGVAPKSSKRHRMEENFASQLLRLSESEMATIEGCNQNLRLNAEFPDHPFYPFHEDF